MNLYIYRCYYLAYSGIIQTSSAENGLCTTLTCTPPNAVVKDASCEGNYNIKGVCGKSCDDCCKYLFIITKCFEID